MSNLAQLSGDDLCMVCGSDNAVSEVVSYRDQVHANKFFQSYDDYTEVRKSFFPVGLGFCCNCGAVQLTSTLNPKVMFAGDYLWATGTGQSTLDFARDFYNRIKERVSESGSVLEIACNDGSFLREFGEHGWKAVGVDPATTFADKLSGLTLDFTCGFFGSEAIDKELATKYPDGFDLVFGRNVIAHVPSIPEVLASMDRALKLDGMAVFEFQDTATMLEQCQYDTVYHEHFTYLSCSVMDALFARFGFRIFDVEASPLSGGALIIYADRGIRNIRPCVQERKSYEKNLGLFDIEKWREFATRKSAHVNTLRNRLEESERVHVLGCSARARVLLNELNLDHLVLAGIYDNSRLKIGTVIPELGLKIRPVDQLTSEFRDGDLLMLGAWNFRGELDAQLMSLGFRGRVLTPFPFLFEYIL